MLANVKLIAEAWDAAGLYQVGSFVGDSWKEWNGTFRDDVRAFLKGDNGTVRALAHRLTGSPDIYEQEEREAEQSINFVTCHDGFTLNDLVSLQRQAQRGERRRQPRRRDRQPELELRRRGTDRRSRRRAAAQPPGEELPDPDAARGRDADAADGRRGPAHAARQQQRLLHQQRDDLVRLGPARKARRRSPLRESAHRASHQPQSAGRAAGHDAREMLRHQPVTWHGVKLDAPDWGHDRTRWRPRGGCRRPAPLHVIVNAYWEPLELQLPHCGSNVATLPRHTLQLHTPADVCGWKNAQTCRGAN